MDNFEETCHPDYEANLYSWVMIRDTLHGESAIKRESELYLPIPAAMLNSTMAPSIQKNGNSHVARKNDVHSLLVNTKNPNYHSNPAYAAYKTRAQFPEIVSGILRGLLGLAQQSTPTFELPAGMAYLEDSTTKSNTGLVDFYYSVLQEALTVGRVGIMVDIDDADGLPKLVTYRAENIINWDGRSNATDEKCLKSVSVMEVDPETGDSLEYRMKEQEGGFVIDVYADGKLVSEGEEVTFRGKRFDKIPMVIAGSSDIAVDVDVAPMSAIARTAIQIYQMDADLRQGEYMSCNPFLVFSGISEDFVPQAIGATTAVVLPPSDARAYYPSTDTSALNHVSNRIGQQYDRALAQGISLVGGANESGEALKIRQQANTATLVAAAEATAAAIEKALMYVAEIMGIKQEVTFEAGTEFGFTGMSAQDQQAMVSNWMAGAISKETMLENFRRAGLLQEGETAQDEMDRLDNQEPMFTASQPNIAANDDEEIVPEVEEEPENG